MRITLTKPDGAIFEIDPANIAILDEAEPGLWAPLVKTIVVYSGDGFSGKQGVQETVAQIKHLESMAASAALQAHWLLHPKPTFHD